MLTEHVHESLPSEHYVGNVLSDYHSRENDYSFDALQTYCFGINIKL